jgi:hypothetical protein
VALKNVQGVQDVNVSLSQGEADVSFAPGNSVRYEQLLRAIEKNGFVIKGASLDAIGRVTSDSSAPELQITGSNEQFKLAAEPGAPALSPALAGKMVEVNGDVPEVAKGKLANVFEYKSILLLQESNP